MNEIWTTVCGNIATDPIHRRTDDGLPIVKFRIASTPFSYSQGQGFVNGTTSYLTVTCFRTLAENAGGSLAKGDPVFAFGKLQVREYETRDGRTGSDTEILAVTLGHDLTKGTSMFRRVSRAAQQHGRTGADTDVDPWEGTELADAPAVPPAAAASMIREPEDLASAGLESDFGRPSAAVDAAGSDQADAA